MVVICTVFVVSVTNDYKDYCASQIAQGGKALQYTN